MEADPPDVDPFVSAVVQVRPQGAEDAGGPPAPDLQSVVSEAAALLEGVDMGTEEPGGPPAGGAGAPDVPGQGGAAARVKGYFTTAGFEVHAPVGQSFSIGGRRSQFEAFFGQSLKVDEERLFSPVTTADGGDHLSLHALPEDVRDLVESVSFPPPPELPPGLGV